MVILRKIQNRPCVKGSFSSFLRTQSWKKRFAKDISRQKMLKIGLDMTPEYHISKGGYSGNVPSTAKNWPANVTASIFSAHSNKRNF